MRRDPVQEVFAELGLRPGFDPDRMNQLLDELQVAETRKKYRPR